MPLYSPPRMERRPQSSYSGVDRPNDRLSRFRVSGASLPTLHPLMLNLRPGVEPSLHGRLDILVRHELLFPISYRSVKLFLFFRPRDDKLSRLELLVDLQQRHSRIAFADLQMAPCYGLGHWVWMKHVSIPPECVAALTTTHPTRLIHKSGAWVRHCIEINNSNHRYSIEDWGTVDLNHRHSGH